MKIYHVKNFENFFFSFIQQFAKRKLKPKA